MAQSEQTASVIKSMSDERIPRYPELKKPEFKSTIPPHLVNKLSDQEKFVIEAISRVEAMNEWIISAVLDGNRSVIESDLRIQEIQDWKALISSKWAVIVAFLMMCFPVVLKALFDRFSKP